MDKVTTNTIWLFYKISGLITRDILKAIKIVLKNILYPNK